MHLKRQAGWGMAVVLLWATSGYAAGDSRLVQAAKEGDAKAALALLRQRVDVNVPEQDGTTALHWAVQRDDLEMAEKLIRAGANVKIANRYGLPPVTVACINGSARMLDMLLRAGADAKVALPAGETALMTCARTGNVATLKLLLEHGADVNARESWHEQTALMWAAAERHPEAVKLLLEHGADVHARSSTGKPVNNTTGGHLMKSQSGGFTPLLFAVRQGDIDSVRVLLKAGAGITEAAPDADGTSALVLAILNGHFELAGFLLDEGADPNVPDIRGSALHVLAWLRRPGPGGASHTGILPRQVSGNLDSFDLAKKLLKHGADPNVRIRVPGTKYARGEQYRCKVPPDLSIPRCTINWDGATPFWVAAKVADVPLMRLLAANGADPLIPNALNVTPLMAAAGVGYVQGADPGTESEALAAAKIAVELGNDVKAVADFGNTEMADIRFSGVTPLHGAAVRGANSIVQWLVDQGVRLDVKTKEGWTPFNIADGIHIGGTFKGNPHTAALLRQHMTARGVPVEELHVSAEIAASPR